MTTEKDPIRELIDSRHPLIYIHSAEEQRVHRWLRRLATEVYQGQGISLRWWSCTRGLSGSPGEADARDGDSRDPVLAIEAFVAADAPGFLVMNDLSPFLDQPMVARALRDAARALSARKMAVLFIVSPLASIPAMLAADIRTVRLPPPDDGEIGEGVAAVLAEYTSKAFPPEWQRELTLSLRGLTLSEVRHVMYRVLNTKPSKRATMLTAITAARIVETTGSAYLDYVPPTVGLADIGGAPNLKEWIEKRRVVFNRATAEAGLPVPKGVLIMGISGCGKSLFAKAIAKTWQVPLFRLDISRVYAQVDGNPEATFLRVLEDIEAMAPVVLWIDEIENGLGLSADDQQAASHILSAFLTWMQEKPPLVFVAATANRIESLPAEMIRKGRFDQVFFCDLPNEAERTEIFSIHIRNNQGDPADFDLPRLLIETKEWNAAEIAQVVIAARIDAAAEQRAFTTEDILRHSHTLVALSQTMSEQIKFIRDWAWDRATPASGVAQEIQFELGADPG